MKKQIFVPQFVSYVVFLLVFLNLSQSFLFSKDRLQHKEDIINKQEFGTGDLGTQEDYNTYIREVESDFNFAFDWRKSIPEAFIKKFKQQLINQNTSEICLDYWNNLKQNFNSIDGIFIEEIKQSLVTCGPVYLKFDLYEDFIDFWKTSDLDDVYKKSSCIKEGKVFSLDKQDQAVICIALIVGWDNSKKAWLCKKLCSSYVLEEETKKDDYFWIFYGAHEYNVNMEVLTTFSEDEHL